MSFCWGAASVFRGCDVYASYRLPNIQIIKPLLYHWKALPLGSPKQLSIIFFFRNTKKFIAWAWIEAGQNFVTSSHNWKLSNLWSIFQVTLTYFLPGLTFIASFRISHVTGKISMLFEQTDRPLKRECLQHILLKVYCPICVVKGP